MKLNPNQTKPKVRRKQKSNKEQESKDSKSTDVNKNVESKETTKVDGINSLKHQLKKLDVDTREIIQSTSEKIFRSELETMQMLIFYGRKYLDLYDEMDKLDNHVMTFEAYVEGNRDKYFGDFL